MERLARLIHELHRRSVWQVLGVFLAASWGVLQVVEVMTETVGLPDWAPSMAFAALLLGLPMVLATAFIQGGVHGADRSTELTSVPDGNVDPDDPPRDDATPGPTVGDASSRRSSPRPSSRRRLFTWKNAVLGGVGAFTLLGISLAAYFVMWTTGIGPVGNLVAQGVITEGERVVLATFDDATGEGLGDVVTEALRVDLAGASVLELVDAADIEPVLNRMQLDPGTRLDGALAREVARREGVGAVIDGEVGSAGAGYVVTATLRAAADGRSIASFRVAAAGPDDVITSIDKLSQDIREKSGESLKTIRAGEPLEQVTTSSIEALTLFTQADRAWDAGENSRALDMLNEAVDLDPGFAMAWRRMSALLGNIGIDPDRQRHAAIQAFEHRDRLTDLERELAAAFYYSEVEQDRARSIAAYENVLRLAPDDRAALNNLGNVYSAIEDFSRARELYRRAVDGAGRSNTAYQNLVRTEIGAGRDSAALAVVAEYREAYPDDATLYQVEFWALFVNGEYRRARETVGDRATDPGQPPFERVTALGMLAYLAHQTGQAAEGRRQMLEAERIAAEVAPGFAWLRRNWTAHVEWAMGDEEWARTHLLTGMEDGAWAALPPFERYHWFTGLNLALLGESARVAEVMADYDAVVPEAERGPDWISQNRRTDLYARVATGTASGAIAELQEIAAEYGCATCYRVEEAWIAEQQGDLDRAIELHEGVIAQGLTFLELNGSWRLRSTLVLPELYEEVGDTAKAIEAWTRVISLWGEGDVRGMRRVRRGQERIYQLGG